MGWTVGLNTIHMDFAEFESPGQGKMHLLFTLSSSLLDHTAMDALIILKFDPDKHGGWTSVTGRRVVPLPTQDSMIHLIDFDDCANVIDTVHRTNPKTTVVNGNVNGQGEVTEAVCVEEFDNYSYTQHSLIMKPELKGAGC